MLLLLGGIIQGLPPPPAYAEEPELEHWFTEVWSSDIDSFFIYNATYARSDTTIVTYNPGTREYSMRPGAPTQINGSSESEPLPYIFSDNYATDGFYQVQSGRIGVRIYDYYAEFWDPYMTEIRLYEERWEVERWKTQGAGSWVEVGAQSGTPIFSVFQDSTGINITKTFSSWAGELNITYVFQDGRSLKHDIVFTSAIAEQTQFGVLQKWAGIVASKVKYEGGESIITSLETVNSSVFAFYKADGNLSIFENQRIMYYGYNDTTDEGYMLSEQNLKPVDVNIHAQGLKADFVFANWTLNQGESLWIDPDTETFRPTGDVLSNWTPKSGGDNYLMVDETVSDDDGTYNWKSGSSMDKFSTGASSGSGEISSVTVYGRAKQVTTGGSKYYMWVFPSGGGSYIGAEETLTTSYVLYSHVWALNPDDSQAWEWADIDGACFGYQTNAFTGGQARTTQSYMVVTYIPNAAPTNDASDSDTTFDVDTYGWVKQTVTDTDGVADLKTVDIQVTTLDSKVFTLRWTQSSNTFSEVSDPDGIVTLDVSGSQRVNVDADTDRIEFKFKISAAAQKGYASVQATVIDDADAQDQDTYSNEFSTNFYIGIAIIDSSHGWTSLAPGATDVLINSPGDGDIDLTITANADFSLKAKGSGALTAGGESIPLANVEIHVTTLGSAISLTTSYVNIPGLTSQTRGVGVSKSFKLWVSVPSPNENGDFTYTLSVQGVDAT